MTGAEVSYALLTFFLVRKPDVWQSKREKRGFLMLHIRSCNQLSFRLEVFLAVEVNGQSGSGFGGVVGEGEAMGVRDGLEAGLAEIGPLGGYHCLQSGPVAMGLKAKMFN